jgi:hypothetical protein
MRWRRPRGCHSALVSSKASSASWLARSPIAWTATGKPARAAWRISSAKCSRLVISTPEPSSSRAVGELVGLLRRQGLPDPQRQQTLVLELLPEAQRPEPAVLVVDGRDAARVRELDAGAHRLDVLVVRDLEVRVAEVPARLLAQDAGRLAALVELDHAAGNLEVAVRARERRRVEPDRVGVARHQRHRGLAGDVVEHLARRLDRRLPLAAPPAAATQPPPLLDARQRVPHERHRFLDRPGLLEPDLVLRDRPGREVDV